MTNNSIPHFVQQAQQSLSEAQPMRRGSLSPRYVKCGKPNCACRRDPKARHGPYYSWTRVVNGKTQSRFLSAAQAPIMRAQIAIGQQFRKRVEDYWEACEQWADQELQPPAPAAVEAAEKKGSARRSKPRSSKRSKRC